MCSSGNYYIWIKTLKNFLTFNIIRKQYKEHVNDHQLQITENFAKEGYIIELKDDEKLQDALEKAKVFQPNKYISNHDRFNDELEKIINK